MEISKKSPIDRIYAWWHQAKYGSTPDHDYTNLCPYVRAVLFWALPRWIWLSGPERVRVAAWTTTICITEVVLWAPWVIFWDTNEVAPWTWSYVFMVIGALSMTAHVVAAFVVGGGLLLFVIAELIDYFNIKESKPIVALGNLGRDIGNLSRGTVTAIHDRVCPIIERVKRDP